MRNSLAILLGPLVLASAGLAFAPPADNPVPVKPLDIDKVRLVNLAKEANVVDRLPGGVFVVSKTDKSLSLRVQCAEARKQYKPELLVAGRLRVPRKPLTMLGRLPGDGTGPNASFLTEIGKPRDFFLSDKTIFLLGARKFTGPYLNHEPTPQAFYFTADLPALPPGRYSVFVRITPEGEVFEKWKKGDVLGLPDFSLLKCDFEVEGKE